MSENLNEIRFRLKSLRIQQGLSLQELAQRTGLSKSTLQRYETGGIRNMPKLESANLCSLHTHAIHTFGGIRSTRASARNDRKYQTLRKYKTLLCGQFALCPAPLSR